MTSSTPQAGQGAAYPVYKPSGIPWLGDVPEHWEIRRLKTLARFGYGDSLAADNRAAGPYPVYGSNGIVGEHDRANTKAPCLIIGRKGSFGKVAFSATPSFAIDTTYFIDSQLSSNDLRWLYYCLQWLRLDSFSKDSAVPGLSREDAYNNVLPFCPTDEQRAIATFLDRETARIDALIEKKQRQIELLQEKRSALISLAVTKGLDPNAKMKESGIEWLGEVPAHWKAVSLRRYLRVSSGDMISVNDFCEEGYPVFGGNGFRGYSDRWNTESDTIIIGRYGALCGNVRVTEERIWATEHAFRVIPLTTFYPKFLAAVIETLDLNRLSARTAQPGLNSEMVRNNVVGIPPISEQKAIADFVAAETTRSDGLVSKIEGSITALREFRTALISAAVTGKIDVRKELV